jgi:hypothetical protein
MRIPCPRFREQVIRFSGFDGQVHSMWNSINGSRPKVVRHFQFVRSWCDLDARILIWSERGELLSVQLNRKREYAGVPAKRPADINCAKAAFWRRIRECCRSGIRQTGASTEHRQSKHHDNTVERLQTPTECRHLIPPRPFAAQPYKATLSSAREFYNDQLCSVATKEYTAARSTPGKLSGSRSSVIADIFANTHRASVHPQRRECRRNGRSTPPPRRPRRR